MKKGIGKLFLLTVMVMIAVLCLYACGEETSFTVTFHNGDEVYATVKVGDGKTVTMPQDPTPATGYTFVGWYLDEEGTSVFQRDGSITDNVDVYAKYAQQQRYVVVDSNGGSAVDRVAVSTGAEYTIPVPTREGYDFVKYTYVDAEGEKHDFATTGTYTLTTNVRITAEWTKRVYTVTLHVEGEEDEEIEIEHGNKVAPNQLAQDGYTFDGWFEQDAQEAYVRTTPVTSDLDLYARFTAKTYLITFDTAGGEEVADYTATYGQAYTLTAPTRAGYTFVGYTLDGQDFALSGTYARTLGARLVANWSKNDYTVAFLDADSEEPLGQAQTVAYNETATLPTVATGYEIEGVYTTSACDGDKITVGTTKITENTTFYVKVKGQNFTISYKVNGGDAIEQLTVEYGKAYTLTQATRTGYDFVRYTVDINGVATEMTLSGTYTYLNNVTVSAVWQIKSYEVTFLDGVTVLKTQNVNHNAYATAVDAIFGYNIDGYYGSGDFGGNAVVLSDYPITETTVFYVKKSPKAASVTVAGWEEASFPAAAYGRVYTLPDPDDETDARIRAKVGIDIDHAWLTFTGYEYNGEPFACTGTIDWVGNITVTPVYTENPDYDKCTVIFIDGVTGESVGASQTFARGGSATYFSAPEKTGYSFVKWATEKSSDADEFDWGTAISVDTTIYAVYRVNQYTVTLDKNNGQPVEQIYVEYGEVLDLYDSLEKRGYTFAGYEYNGEAFEIGQDYVYTTDITITAVYTRNTREVDFYADGSLIDTVTVYQYDAVTPIAEPEKTGYTFLYWSLSAGGAEYNPLTEVENDTNLYAVFSVNTYKVTVDENGGEEVAVIDVDYGATLTLPATMVRRGYTFTHFTLDGEEYAGGMYTFTTDITVVAQYTRNERTVNFRNENGELYANGAKTIYQYQTVEAMSDPTKTGYTFVHWSLSLDGSEAFDFASEIENNTDLYAVFEANKYVIYVRYDEDDIREIPVVYNEEYNIPEASRFGYTFVKYTRDGEDFTAIEGVYTETNNMYLVVVWEDHSFYRATNSMGNDMDYFFEVFGDDQEYTLVLLVGATYTFDGYALVAGGETLYQKTAPNEITTVLTGDFTMNLYIDADGDPVKTYKTKVVYDVTGMETGSNFNSMIANATLENFKIATQRAAYVQSAGVEYYIPDLSITDKGLNILTLEEANIEVTVFDEENNVIAPNLYVLSENRFDFDETLIGRTLKLSFAPKYDIHDRKPIDLTVSFNDGKNVYTNAELKSYYSNTQVHTVNILRNIKAELAESDYVIGHGKNMQDVTIYKNVSNGVYSNPVTLHDVDTGAPLNDTKARGVYVRTGDKNDRIVVNGNYFAIDGSSLPYIDNRYGEYGSTTGQYSDAGANYLTADVQIGIFFYQSADLKANGYRARKWATGTATFNNLRIEGNALPEYASYAENIGEEKALLKMSAAYLGMIIRGGTVTTDNVTIRKTAISTMLHGQVSGFDAPGYSDGVLGQAQEGEKHATNLIVNNGIIEKNWGNSFYVYDLCTMTLSNTDIGMSFGPAISVDDKPYANEDAENTDVSENGYSNLDIEINMDHYTATHVDCWISGDEVWYTAYGLTQSATGAKSLIENGVKSVNDNLTILRWIDGVQKMNFVIMVKPADASKNSWWLSDKQGQPYVKVSAYTAVENDGGNVVVFGNENELKASADPAECGEVMLALGAYQQYMAASDAAKEAAAQAYAAGDMETYQTKANEAKIAGTNALQSFLAAGPYIEAAAATPLGFSVALYVPIYSTLG